MTEVLVCDHFLILQLNLCPGLFSSFPVSPLSQHVPRKPESLLVCVCESCSVVSNSSQPHGLQPTRPRPLCPWNSPGKNTGMGNRSLLQGIFLTQGSNPGILHCRQILYYVSHQGSPISNLTHLRIY